MNDVLFAQELAAVLAGSGYSALVALVPNILPVQAAEVTARPTIGISGEYQPYLQRRKGMVTLELRSRIGDETEAGEHQARFVALWAALFGAQGADEAATRAALAAAKAALQSAAADRGNVVLIEYGYGRDAVSAGAPK